MAQQINAFFAPLVAAACGPRLAPALHDAQQAELKRRKEDLAVEESVNDVLAWAQAHRPKNTSRNYLPKQKEWRAWCETMDFRPGGEYLPYDWVDEGKLLLFVKTQVAERAPRKGRRLAAEKKRKLEEEAEAAKKKKNKRRRQEDGTMVEVLESPDSGDEPKPEPELFLMYNSVHGYVSAIMELWAHQVSQKLHSSPSPHNVAVKALKTSIVRGEHQRRRTEFEDRGLSTIKDRYTAKQIPDMTKAVWRNALGPRTSEQSLRTNLDFLLGHAMLLRQSNRLPIELPDLFLMDLPREGQKGKGWCLVVVMDQGKTNQHGRLEYGAALRHRDYQSCAVGALATYLFWRWHHSGEAFPCFRTSRDWYNIKLLKRDNSHRQERLNSSTASDWTRRLYKVAGLKVTKLSHAPRESGPQIAELNGVPEGQIRRGGRWNNDQMTGCYLTTLPFEFMRGQADFEPTYASSYFLPRDIQPPERLRRMVWPDLDRWRAAHLELPEATEQVEPNLAAGAFLELLDRLRDVFLQDSVLFRREYPDHDIFNNPLFETLEYKQFEEDVATAVGAAREEDPQLVAIQKAIPAVCDRLRTISGVVQTGLEGNDSSIQRVEGRIAALENVVNDFCSGAFNLTFTPGSRRAQESLPLCSLPPFRLPAAAAAPSFGPAPAPTAIQSLAAQPPTYHLSRGVTTIPDLWREWTVGLGGQQSVESLDERWGSRWRHGAEFQFYSRRKVIIDEIKRLVAGGREAIDVVDSLEEQRLTAKASLSQVINALKAAAKARK